MGWPCTKTSPELETAKRKGLSRIIPALNANCFHESKFVLSRFAADSEPLRVRLRVTRSGNAPGIAATGACTCSHFAIGCQGRAGKPALGILEPTGRRVLPSMTSKRAVAGNERSAG